MSLLPEKGSWFVTNSCRTAKSWSAGRLNTESDIRDFQQSCWAKISPTHFEHWSSVRCPIAVLSWMHINPWPLGADLFFSANVQSSAAILLATQTPEHFQQLLPTLHIRFTFWFYCLKWEYFHNQGSLPTPSLPCVSSELIHLLTKYLFVSGSAT